MPSESLMDFIQRCLRIYGRSTGKTIELWNMKLCYIGIMVGKQVKQLSVMDCWFFLS